MGKSVTLKKNIKVVTSKTLQDRNIRHLTIKKGVEVFEDECFSDMESLEIVEFPSKILYMGKSLFKNCKNLESVVLPTNINTVPESMFQGCEILEGIDIPESVSVIEKNAFSECYLFKNVLMPGIIEIKDNAFKSCEKLRIANMPNKLKCIGSHAFYGCKELFDLQLNDGLESIDNYAFSRSGVRFLTLPDTVKYIGQGAFCDTYLYSIKLSNNINKIERSCFSNSKLKNIVIPESVACIGEFAFQDCSMLESVKLPLSVNEVRISAFKNCTNLKEIIIENDKIRIGRNAFSNCNSINTIVYRGKKIDTTNLVMENFTKKSLDYVDENLDKITQLLAKVPLISLLELKEMGLDEDFFTNAYYKNYKMLREKLFTYKPDAKSEKSFFALCYTLGVFDKELSHKSSQIILRLIEKNVFKGINIDEYVGCLTLKNLDREMIRDITDKQLSFFYNLAMYSKNNHSFLGICLENYNKVQKTNISKSNGPLKPTLDKFVDYFSETKFGDIESEDDKVLAKELAKFYSQKETFRKSKTVFKTFNERKIAESLVSENIRKEKRRFLESGKQFSQFMYEFLKKSDPRNLTVARYFSGCCGHIEGKGQGICIASVLDPLTQTLVMNDNEGNPVSKAVFSVIPKSKCIVINAIYVDYIYCSKKEEELVKKYTDTFKLFIDDYNENNGTSIEKVYLGKKSSALIQYFNKSDDLEYIMSVNYGNYGIDFNYPGDWQKGQICIYNSKN